MALGQREGTPSAMAAGAAAGAERGSSHDGMKEIVYEEFFEC